MHNNNINYSLHTQFENRFFNLLDYCNLTLHCDSKEFSIDKMEIFRLYDRFKEEIFENITRFNQYKKIIYLERILERIKKHDDNCLTESVSSPGEIKIIVKGIEFKPVSDFNAYCHIIARKKNKLTVFINSLIEPCLRHETFEIKPVFNHPNLLPAFIEVFQSFFSSEQRPLLIKLLKTGKDSPEPLNFHGSGSSLADTFKQLYNSGMISGCDKKQLEGWILRNFRYTARNKINQFNSFYLSKIISTNIDICRKPIIDVFIEKSTGKILIKKT